jgi:cytochrome c biogenesis protein CcdA
MLLLLSLIAIALVDSLNPSIILMTLYLLSTEKPLNRTTAYISGVFLTNWALGLLAYFGLGAVFSVLIDRVVNASAWWVYALELVAGIALLVAAYSVNTSKDAKLHKKPKAIDPRATFVLGIVATFIEFSTAAPYLAAIAVLTRADVSSLYAVFSFAVYNIVYVIIPLALFAVYLYKKEQATPTLARINKKLSHWVKKAMRVVFVLLGILLIADFIAYLFGSPFFG